jgi:hypothetical protein
VDALQPPGALTDDRLAQPHLDAQIEDVRRRNPRLGQALVHQQLAQQARVNDPIRIHGGRWLKRLRVDRGG